MSPNGFLRKAWFPLIILIAATSCTAADSVRVLETLAVAGEEPDGAKPATHDLRLQLHTFKGSRWGAGDAALVAWEAARVLSQCGIAFAGGEVRVLETPDRFHQYAGPVARDLMRATKYTKPAVFFVEGMRDPPGAASDAVGRANAAERPELADTVWLAYGQYDLVLTLAHELVHVLTDNAEHVSEAGNLMNGEYSPANSRLTQEQCEQLTAKGEANGLLKRR
jgi:hypothetical protein